MQSHAARRVILSCVFVIFVFTAATAQKNDQPEPYSVVHGWPVLPEGFAFGQVSGVAVDSHNHIFVFHRAENSWAADKSHPIPSPAILCFDGAFVGSSGLL